MRDIKAKTEEAIAKAALFVSGSVAVGTIDRHKHEDARYAAKLFGFNRDNNPSAKRHANKASAEEIARLIGVLRGDKALGPVLSALEAVVEEEGEALTVSNF